jgi:hypothetical protein
MNGLKALFVVSTIVNREKRINLPVEAPRQQAHPSWGSVMYWYIVRRVMLVSQVRSKPAPPRNNRHARETIRLKAMMVLLLCLF